MPLAKNIEYGWGGGPGWDAKITGCDLNGNVVRPSRYVSPIGRPVGVIGGILFGGTVWNPVSINGLQNQTVVGRPLVRLGANLDEVAKV